MQIRQAEPDRDNERLCVLARRCPQGERFRFYHQRRDGRARLRWQPDGEVWVIEDRGRLAAAAAVARKPLRLAGAWQPTAYLFDLMVDPDFRGRGLARRLVRVLREAAPDARLLYSYIVEDNRASRTLFESEGFSLHPRRLLYHVMPCRSRMANLPPGFELCEPVGAADAAPPDALLRERYELADPSAGQEGLFRLIRHGSRAWAVLRRPEPQVLVRMPWYVALLGRTLPFLPRYDRPLHSWSLHHLAADGAEPGMALRHLVRSAAGLAEAAGADVVFLPLFEDDPRAADVVPLTLSGLRLPTGGAARLYVGGELGPAVLASRRPLLMSGRDG